MTAKAVYIHIIVIFVKKDLSTKEVFVLNNKNQPNVPRDNTPQNMAVNSVTQAVKDVTDQVLKTV